MLLSMSFIQKSLSSGSLGQDCIDLRERLHMSRAQAAKHSKIQESLLRTWEENRWDEIDDPIHNERLLKTYVLALGGNVAYMIRKYHASIDAQKLQRRTTDLLPRVQKPRFWEFLVGYRLVASAVFLCAVVILGGYITYRVRHVFQPPMLVLESPHDGIRLEEPVLHVEGMTDPDARVTVGGRQAFVDDDGRFTADIDVPRGTTLVVIEAKRRYGKVASEARRVIYDRSVSVGANIITSE